MSNNSFTKSLLIIGWNQRTINIINWFEDKLPSLNIFVIDQTLQEIPENYSKKVNFIIGNPMNADILKKANITEAVSAIITADRHISETYSDSKSIITLLALKDLNPKLHSTVEILTSTQIINAKRAGADNIIHTGSAFRDSLVKSINDYHQSKLG